MGSSSLVSCLMADEKSAMSRRVVSMKEREPSCRDDTR